MLILTDLFPPLMAVGGRRVLALARHLSSDGCRVSVVTVRPRPDQPVDMELADRIPPQVRVVRTASPNPLKAMRTLFKKHRRQDQPQLTPEQDQGLTTIWPRGPRRIIDWLSWWLHIPDGRAGWLGPGLWATVREIQRLRPDVLFSSAPSWTCHVAAAAAAKISGLPWVADFRDIWHANPFCPMPYRTHVAVDRWLESQVVGRADQITCAWEGIRRLLLDRYPRRADDIHTILNGFDPEQLDRLAPARLADNGRCVLVHAGTLYGPRSPAPLLEALHRLKSHNPAAAAKLLNVFLGCTQYNGVSLDEIVRRHGVGELVTVMPAVSHREAMAYVKGASVAVLFGQCGDRTFTSVPAKVYEYIGAGKPVLAIQAGDEAVRIIRQAGCRCWSASNTDDIAEALRAIADEHAHGRLLPATQDAASRMAFTHQRMSRNFLPVLEQAAGRRG